MLRLPSRRERLRASYCYEECVYAPPAGRNLMTRCGVYVRTNLPRSVKSCRADDSALKFS